MSRFALFACLLLSGCVITVPPVPPIPTPDPVVPTPIPTPVPPTPQPVTGPLAVLIITDPEGSPISQAQSDAIFGGDVRQYLNTHCDKEKDGTPQRRWLAKDANVSHESLFWRDAYVRYRGKPAPYIVITNGVRGTEGPCPATEAEMLAVLKKFGGE